MSQEPEQAQAVKLPGSRVRGPQNWLPKQGTIYRGERLRQACRTVRKFQAQEAKRAQIAAGTSGLKGMGKRALAMLTAILVALGIVKRGSDSQSIQQLFDSANRPEFLPRFIAAAKRGHEKQARYWLRRALAR